MIKYGEIIGIPIICFNDSKKVGNIKDVVIYKKYKSVTAFYLLQEGLRKRKKIILIENILDLNNNSLVIEDLSYVQDYEGKEEKEENRIVDIKVYSKYQRDLGTIKDFWFDEKTGRIEALEVSDGIIRDIINGRNIIPLIGKVDFKEDSILIDNEANEEIIESSKGLKKLLISNLSKR